MSAELFDTYLTPWMRYKLITWHKEYLTTLLAAKHLHDLTKTGEQKKNKMEASTLQDFGIGQGRNTDTCTSQRAV